MESPVVLDKPTEYHSKGTQNNNDKGFPFDEDEAEGGAGGAWGSLAARHPDIAARLRARPSAWGRKRRSSHGGTSGTSGDGARPVAHADDDFPAGLGEHFDRFPFDDIPPEFREHFPGHWGQRFTPREREREPPAPQPAPPQTHSPPPQHKPHQNTISTQTEEDPIPTPIDPPGAQNPGPSGTLPQYGLRNTVDLGQKTPADPSFVDAEEERNQRSMSAPPDNRMPTPSYPGMGNSTGGSAQPPPEHHDHGASNVRHIPIFVEGRDEPIVNRAHPEAAAYAEPKQQYAPPPPQPDRDYYEPGMGFHHPPNFSRAFGTPFGKGYRQGPQPFAPQKAYQQSSAPPGRSQSPKPQPPPQQQYTQIPVHQQNVPPPAQRQQSPQPPPPQRQPSPQPPPPQRQGSPPPPPPQPAPPMNDPIAKILSIQKDVLDLMTDVENFVGTKADKRYIYLDEMLTRNLIKLDDIETEGKENIRQARKEAIKCIQKCIAVLEAKADGKIPTTPQPAAVEMNLEQNGRAEGDAQPKQSEPAAAPAVHNPNLAPTDNNPNPTKESGEEGGVAGDAPEPTTEDTMAVPKKTKKVVKKRDKSKDNNTNNDANQNEENQAKDVEMQVAQNSDSNQANPPPMESEGSAVSSQ